MKKILIIILFISNSVVAQTIKPLTSYSFEQLLNDENANHFVLEGCVSLYSAIIELTKKKYPDLANEFFEIANTIYPYGIISLSKKNSISYEEAEKIFFANVSNLTNEYIDEMNRNGKNNGSFFKGSFLGDDLRFCHEVTKLVQSIVLESLGE